MSDNLLQRSVTTSVARNLATTTKTSPKMMSITPRYLLKLLPWVQVNGGTYRVNRTKVELAKAERIAVDVRDDGVSFPASALRRVPLFSRLPDTILERMSGSFRVENVPIGNKLLVEGEDRSKFFVIAQGQVEVLSKGVHGSDLRIALLTEGYGERNIDLVSGFAENVEIPETFVDYSPTPREYSLSAVQTVVRVHTRVSDLYNGPYNQLEEQMRLTIEGIKERQEWELINSKKFGLLHSVDPAMRISPRYGAPTPDDLDELLALVWKKPAFFVAHPKAIAAFLRECTWRGVPPVTVSIFGHPVASWRGVPIIPCDKLEVTNRYQSRQSSGTTSILLVRTGEEDQGVVGLHQTGIEGEIAPSLSARLMGLDSLGVSSYLLTLYFSAAVLTDDALGVLENVEVGYYHDYVQRVPKSFDSGSGI
jgi:hypothetical protein